ncbi:hypothetical protein BDU57DRAFT_527537 [Ampelomyces quisqualis]|uniref:Uncharacterized protein n=1 Tax=Ampelomyces quisqualis TaxID=50730 RepID=A0A6A5QX62_AMPQU|nr:hypothetical protein BDU57DRAFT_527537 [Ampelomyces quisqualis]
MPEHITLYSLYPPGLSVTHANLHGINARLESLPQALVSEDASCDLRVLAFVNELLDELSIRNGEQCSKPINELENSEQNLIKERTEKLSTATSKHKEDVERLKKEPQKQRERTEAAQAEYDAARVKLQDPQAEVEDNGSIVERALTHKLCTQRVKITTKFSRVQAWRTQALDQVYADCPVCVDCQAESEYTSALASHARDLASTTAPSTSCSKLEADLATKTEGYHEVYHDNVVSAARSDSMKAESSSEVVTLSA